MAQLVNGNALAGESQHWYRRDGTPQYTVIGKNGKERPATLRDAREHNLVPGQSSITKCAAAPGLIQYFKYQAIWAALTATRREDEEDDMFIARILADSEEAGKKAADKGTEIHAALECSVLGKPWDERLAPWVEETFRAMNRKGVPWKDCIPERSYAHPAGYGCKIDIHNDDWVIDFKTKEGSLDGKLWDEHAMQLAANRRAARKDGARCAIVFVRRDQPEALFVEVPEDDLMRGLCMFDSLLAYWQYKNRYCSAWQE